MLELEYRDNLKVIQLWMTMKFQKVAFVFVVAIEKRIKLITVIPGGGWGMEESPIS